MTREEIVKLDERVAKQKSERLWNDGIAQQWLSFCRLKDQNGKCTILSFHADGPFVFIDRRGALAGKVISECYFCQEHSYFVEKISDRPIGVEAHRMFKAGVGLDLIKQHFSLDRKAVVVDHMLSEATRFQLNSKFSKKLAVQKSSHRAKTPLGI